MKVAVTSKAFSKNEVLISELRQHFSDVRLNLTGRLLEGEELNQFLFDRDGAIVAMEQMVPQVVEQLPNLQVISKFGVGLNNIDIEYCEAKNIAVRWTSGVNRCSVAEMTLGFMLMLMRNLYLTSTQLSNGYWNKSGGQSLYGKTIGIIGLGHIGKELVNLLAPFNCEILINDIIEQKTFCSSKNLKSVDKKTLFACSDIVTLHTPLTEDTRGLIDDSCLSQMRKESFIINTARGELIDLIALKKALKNGMIAGAAIDVYDSEPPQDKELLGLDNLICTPHIGGNSAEATLAMGRSAINHLVDYFHFPKLKANVNV
jgi:phosphoglycerate dehydrogenase-like enzyme